MKAAIIGIAGTALTGAERALLEAMPPAGVILFARNIENPLQLADLVADLRSCLPSDAVLMIDQEGGRVARLRAPHWTELPAAATLGALFATDPYAARKAARAHGAALGALARGAGFDVVTAPVLDVPVAGADAVIGDRAISTDPIAVGALGADIAWGLLFQGIQPVMKHLPGHGRATIDSHAGLPRISATQFDTDLAPFAANSELPWGMTAHIVYERWDAENPATFSHRVIADVIRGKIGFRGILVSDDLAMGALDGPPEIRATRALAAGCDIALYCPGALDDNRAVLAACPDLDPSQAAKLKARPPS
ncbi:beta-N-acetylhexosaminidase [Acidiphilium sp. AL]|uniref:beta-N-acetylhexosaminidase n=1 Tax=Acidiphilium iwatense TaxID=768198 RepID=A0ABS9DZ64_9PROT|nr:MULTISPECIES: beta-N-acetylhexosaminidase [Acidiphilium]MCF3947080.1 beta-N-acetylhexosaminidase [Acidiphilium iwatense]MCU4160482.1 beta-N-acetylhexosaminidase [Acidiphilium sp. AL]